MERSHIEVDNRDGSSGSGSGVDSDTNSLLLSARDHIFENGRRFHGYKQGLYLMPNDEAEQDRMDLEHAYHLLALQGELYTAPLKGTKPERILDLGTGTGIWCIDAGDEFPEAQVYGIDLSPIQPQWVPPNVMFEVDDLNEEWMWPENYFDYIHIRQLAAWIDDWPRMIKQAYRALKPGGYIEIQDLTDFFHCDDGSLPTDSCLNQWIHLADQALRQIDRPWLGVQDLCRELFRREGFVEITERSVKCPIGTWPRDKVMKEIGLFARQMKYDGVEAFILSLFTKVLKWDAEKVMEFAEKAKKELMNSKYHSYERFYCIYSRKPPVQED